MRGVSLLDLPSTRDGGLALERPFGAAGARRARSRRDACRTTLPWIDCERDGPRLLFVDGGLDASAQPPRPGRRSAPSSAETATIRSAGSPAATGWTLRARPRPCAAGPRPDRPCLDRRRRSSRRRDRARRRRPGLGRRDLRRRRLGQPADRHRARQGRAADAQPAAARRRAASSASPTRPSSAKAPAWSSTTLAAGGATRRLDGEIDLAGEGAFAEVGGALLARGRQRHDANLVVRHAAPERHQPPGLALGRRRPGDLLGRRPGRGRARRAEDRRRAVAEGPAARALARRSTPSPSSKSSPTTSNARMAPPSASSTATRSSISQAAASARGEAKALLTRAFVADALDRIGEEAVREAFYGRRRRLVRSGDGHGRARLHPPARPARRFPGDPGGLGLSRHAPRPRRSRRR